MLAAHGDLLRDARRLVARGATPRRVPRRTPARRRRTRSTFSARGTDAAPRAAEARLSRAFRAPARARAAARAPRRREARPATARTCAPRSRSRPPTSTRAAPVDERCSPAPGRWSTSHALLPAIMDARRAPPMMGAKRVGADGERQCSTLGRRDGDGARCAARDLEDLPLPHLRGGFRDAAAAGAATPPSSG